MKTTELLAQYLSEHNVTTRLGVDSPAIPFSESDEKLLGALKQVAKGNTSYVVMMYCALSAILIVSFYFIFYYRDSPTIIITLFSGATLSTFGVISRMHRIWVDKSKNDLLILSFPFLDRKERINVVMAVCRIEDAGLFSFGETNKNPNAVSTIQ
jgi:hypothetical protein